MMSSANHYIQETDYYRREKRETCVMRVMRANYNEDNEWC